MSARAWVAFAAVSMLRGIPHLFIRVAIDDGVLPGPVSLQPAARALRGSP
jgi:hypothetical protein